jgi:hypothetical protein
MPQKRSLITLTPEANVTNILRAHLSAIANMQIMQAGTPYRRIHAAARDTVYLLRS